MHNYVITSMFLYGHNSMLYQHLKLGQRNIISLQKHVHLKLFSENSLFSVVSNSFVDDNTTTMGIFYIIYF